MHKFEVGVGLFLVAATACGGDEVEPSETTHARSSLVSACDESEPITVRHSVGRDYQCPGCPTRSSSMLLEVEPSISAKGTLHYHNSAGEPSSLDVHFEEGAWAGSAADGIRLYEPMTFVFDCGREVQVQTEPGDV